MLLPMAWAVPFALFYDIDNDSIVKGLDDVQHVYEAISSYDWPGQSNH